MAEPSLRESLLAAQQQVQQRPESTPAAPVEEPSDDVDVAPEVPPEHAPESPDEALSKSGESSPQRTRDEAGRFAKAEAAARALKQGQPAVAPTAAQPVAPIDGPKAPAAWKPDSREHWSKLPPEVRQEVARREQEMGTILRQGTEHRKMAEGLERTLQPYRAFLHGDPLPAIGNLLQTAVDLQTGTAEQKAAIVGQIIKGYGVNVETLAAMLDGQAPAQTQPQQFRDPRFDQFLGQLQQAQQQRSEQTRASASRQLEEFAGKAEFLNDVREDMADLMALARQRGREMTLDEAYERACLAHPDVRSLYQQRKATQEAANARASTQRARAASSSIRHEPTAPAEGPQSTSLRDTILAAMNSSGRR
jgi:hypothetical protein